MTVSLSELKVNVGKYVDLSDAQDIYITKNGKQVAKIVSTKIDRVAMMESLFGIIPRDVDMDAERMERILK